ncbi:hypothetical protein ACFTXM_32210 [Streptomyces sp. NPDC056930]|uniref:hypothetical protein n=1 Tax=Streptomyces sp. NPDC056930 TaxID=3345967 RepID=UPI003638D310
MVTSHSCAVPSELPVSATARPSTRAVGRAQLLAGVDVPQPQGPVVLQRQHHAPAGQLRHGRDADALPCQGPGRKIEKEEPLLAGELRE